uniref:Transmembrane protein 14C n=1 Tax=Onchocerca volvulus TaxID=6282 RepID=A0A8R1Y0Z4_ONCVO
MRCESFKKCSYILFTCKSILCIAFRVRKSRWNESNIRRTTNSFSPFSISFELFPPNAAVSYSSQHAVRVALPVACKNCNRNARINIGVTMSDLVGLAYAGIIIAGGLFGYFKAGSTMSLTAGLGFGSVAGLAAYFNNNPVLLVVSSGLALIMGIRFIYSGKIMPAGIVAVLR